MKLQLKFETPLRVSSTGFEKDIIRVKFEKSNVFYDEIDGLTLNEPTIIEKQLPLQFESKD